MENSILKRKIETLSQLCENHKSRYEQLSAKYKYEIEDQQNKSRQEIASLKSQLIVQSQQLLANQQEIANLKQQCLENKLQCMERDKSYSQKLKHMQQRLSHRLSTIEQLENQVKERDLEITVLNTKLDTEDHECNISLDDHVSNFDLSDLNGPYPLPIYKRYRSPSTINITNAPESFTMSQNQHPSLSSWQKQYIMNENITPTMDTNASNTDTVSISKDIIKNIAQTPNMIRSSPEINLGPHRISNTRPKAYKLRPETSTPNTSASYDNDILEEIDFEDIESLSDSESHELPPFNNMGSDPYEVAAEPMLVKRSRNSFLMTMLERSETEISFDVIIDEGLEYRE